MKPLKYNTDLIGPTFTGQVMDLKHLNINDIKIEDIVHALSMQCRFGGHTKRFYSVAEHSYLMAHHLWAEDYPPRLQMMALLHDASEYLLSDVMRPIRRQAWMVEYNNFHTFLQSAIEQLYIGNITARERMVISDYDRRILVDEKKQLLSCAVEWDLECDGLGILLFCWPPHRAEQNFLRLYHELETQFAVYAGIEDIKEKVAHAEC